MTNSDRKEINDMDLMQESERYIYRNRLSKILTQNESR